MRPLLFSLLAALCFHLILFRLPGSYTVDTLPQVTGTETIKISLTTPAVSIQQQEITTTPPATIPEKTAPQNIPATRHKKRFPPVQPEILSTTSNETAPDNPKPVVTKPQAVQESTRPAIVKARPLYQQNPKPAYPAIAKRRNWEGTTILLVTISKQGKVKQVRVLTGSGYKMLDNAALSSVRKWHFLPGTENGKPAAMEVLVPIHFTLR